MKILLSFVVTLGLFCTTLQAQENQKEIKNNLGFNTNVIFNGLLNTGGGQYNLMYKRETSANHAIRYGLTFGVNLISESGMNPNYSTNNNYNFSPSVGKEWQISVSKKWIWYYGADIRLNLSGSTIESYTNSIKSSRQQTDRYGISFNPFLGIRYAISDRLYLATEANLSISYASQKIKNLTCDVNGLSTVTQDYSNQLYNAGTGSAVGIFVFYRF